ncbi:MAG: O-antigen ligase family protein [Clostridia bacterium]|nr:O-antigen ligase family protein [Clostridia bacterium]
MKDNTRQIGFISIAFFASLFCVGLFHEYLSCIMSLFLTLWLFVNHLQKNKTVIHFNLTTVTLVLIVLFYGITAFWAVDSGMGVIGFLKYLPLFLFALSLMQTEEKRTALFLLPYVVTLMVVLSAALAQIPLLKDYFLVSGRLGGFLQYPNTFAIIILVSELLLLSKSKIKHYDLICIALLVGGLIYTGSRTVFVLAIIANIATVLFTKSKRFIFFSVLALLAGGFVAVVYLISSENTHIVEDLLNVTFKESSFVGRFLYYVDALPVILKNPFGLGYMGYSFMQSSFQSGIYSTAYIYNDFLQLMLDIGWVPSLLFVFVILKRIFGKNTERAHRIILSTLTLHSLLNFNMQFLSVFFIYILFLDIDSGKEYVISGKKWLVCTLAAVVSCTSIYMGTSLLLYRMGQYDASYAMYPYNPNTETAILINTKDIETANTIATKAQKRNKYFLLTYSIKSRYAYSKNDFTALISIKNQTFEIAPFVYEEYEEYARMLINGITHYKQTGDENYKQICIEELKSVPQKLEKLNDRLSSLGKRIKEHPKTRLPDVLVEYIEGME